jgi:uncharacterized membrane protein
MMPKWPPQRPPIRLQRDSVFKSSITGDVFLYLFVVALLHFALVQKIRRVVYKLNFFQATVDISGYLNMLDGQVLYLE